MQQQSLAQLVSSGCVLLVDKDSGWTSHDAVACARRALGTRKVGHAGTLDPLATGVLTLGVGPATRLLTHMVGLDKVYTATIRLGQATVSDDSESAVTHTADPARMAQLQADPSLIVAAAQSLTGQIAQVPSAVSAIKVAGKRAYDRVRAGEAVQLQPRTVTVHSFELGQPRPVSTAAGQALDVDCRVRVSSGTYVRALARDLGLSLGVYGHLTALRRESVGPFSCGQAVKLSELSVQAQTVKAGGAADVELLRPLPAAQVAELLFGALRVDVRTAIALRHGKQPDFIAADAQLRAAIDPDGKLVALVRVRNNQLRVVTGFPISADSAPHSPQLATQVHVETAQNA